MRIALVTPQWSGTIGGPSNYTAALERELRSLGHTVSVVTTDSGPGAIHIGGSGPMLAWWLFKELKELRPDIVHLHGRAHFIPSALLYRRLSPASRVIFTFHTQPYVGAFVPELPNGKRDYNLVSQFIVSLLLRRCDKVTTVSRSIVDNLNRLYFLGIRNFETVPSGGYPNQIDSGNVNEFRSRHELEGHFPVLASVGVFSWDWKVAGHRLCIDAVAQLVQRYPGLLLLIAGDGQYRSLLEAYTQTSGVQKNVRFLGNVQNSADVLGAADLYLHMAMNEGCSLALVEAMLAGKAIIASRLGGNPEVIEDGRTGRLIAPDAPILALTVLELLQDEEKRDSLSRAAQIHASGSFTWPNVARRYEAIYSRVLSS